MAKEIKTEILIHATPEKVWVVLTDFDNYKNWNPFIQSITGEVAVGNTITARLEPPGARGMTIRPKVLAFTPNKELRWLGHFLVPGLFDGEHSFELIDKGNVIIAHRRGGMGGQAYVPSFIRTSILNFISMEKELP